MNHFKAWPLVWAATKFTVYQRVFVGPATVTLGTETVTNFLDVLGKAERAFKSSGIRDGANRMKAISTHITAAPMHVAAALGSEARHARTEIANQLKIRKFLRVAADRVEFLDKDDLFGSAVTINFPSAEQDIKEAGNCLAAECSTAAVFHLMRAAEIALRALAIDRGVSYPNATVESKQVGDLVVALDAKVKELRNTPATTWASREIMDAQIKFYAEAMVQFRGFNEAWRKHMAHAHEGAIYGRSVALGIMGHVRSLMQLLATKISESNTTPQYWPSA